MKTAFPSAAAALLISLPCSLPAADNEAPDAGEMLEQAMISMARLKSYHIQAELTVQGKKATLEGDLGKGTLFLKGTDIQGERKQRIVAGGVFYLSRDDGKTWTSGPAADQDGTIFLSQLITGPVNPGLRIWEKGDFKTSTEKSGNETLIKIEKAAAGGEPATTYWLVRESSKSGSGGASSPSASGAAEPLHIRRASLTIDSEAGEFPVTVTYSKFNGPVKIGPPAVEQK